ncbi:MAG: metallophosphoesterase family protein [Terriglobales bacterium]
MSDIHSNLEALESCLAAAPAHDMVANLGDVVGYGASPGEVIQRVKKLGEFFVRGNHDKAVCGITDLKDFNPVAGIAALWTREQLPPEDLEWLRALPAGPAKLDGLDDVQFVHGSPVDEDEYLVTFHDAIQPLMVSSSSVTFFGHTHLQGSFSATAENVGEVVYPEYKTVGQNEISEFPLKDGVRYLVNPGSVGQPRDGNWRAAFAMFDSESRVVTFCRTPYNLKGAQERILAANLPQRLATRLAAGR